MDQIFEMVSDVLLGAGALGAAIYCVVLARRLKRFSTLENGVGGAVAVLSAQVDDMTRTLDAARKAAGESSRTLTDLTERAEAAARKLELMMASLHDLPDETMDGREGAEAAQDADWERAAAPPPAETPMFSTRRVAVREAVQ
ncbi:hypothetical protein [Sinisalibacter aestuarii]|uniref:DUF1043 family protein n=1 Tax=Sinisalibacter aestuarii TaxID=2949426 RepID=A0ABQ5LQY6_9RHOB|nr:hypothetical protein [Sinisalibacter aestuarii]GKY86676.1 hypothetical protein STA1M1_05450 [Sinisalibacter aestuarii]